MSSLNSAVLMLIVTACVLPAADKLPKPDRIPAPPTPEQVSIIKQGVALHDQRDYAGAIAKYKQVLAENPWEVWALHELSLSYFANKDYESAISAARLGAQCRTEGLTNFYVMMGNALDELGRNKESIEIYKSAIKQQPNTPLLHYNLAISLKRAGKNADAKKAVQEGLRIAPDHPSSHAFLGGLYQEMGYRIPAILAYSRFLALEPDSARAANVMPVLLDLLTRGVNKGKQQNEINIMISETPKGLKDEGDFTGVEMMMSLMMAADLMDLPKDDKEQAKPKAPKTGFEKLTSIYTSMGEALENAKPRKGFALTYYAPYFTALAKEEHVEAFTAHAWGAGKIEGSADWLKANEVKMTHFQAWSKGYSWQSK